MAANRSMSSSGFLSRWILACAVGEAVGLVFAGIVAAAAMPGAEATEDAMSWLGHGPMLLAGLLEGSSIGTAQWWALRGRVGTLRLGPFVSVTATAMALSWGMGSMMSLLEPAGPPSATFVLLVAALSGAGVGVIIGASQWLVLRRHGRAGLMWIGTTTGGWALGMTVQTIGASLLPAGPYEPVMALLGLVTGASTGLVLALTTSPAVVRLVADTP